MGYIALQTKRMEENYALLVPAKMKTISISVFTALITHNKWMHRISTLPGNEPQEENTFIEQPSAPVIFLTSATSDITCLSTVLKLPDNNNWKNKIRALPIAYLSSNASIEDK